MNYYEILEVEFKSKQNCFVSLPRKLYDSRFKASKQNVNVFELIKDEVTHYVQCSEFHNENSYKIYLDKKFGDALKLTAGENVMVCKYNDTSSVASQVFIKPVHTNDMSTIENNSEMIEQNLLNQLRIVWHGMKFPFWINSTLSIDIEISEIAPKCKFSVLEERTDLIVRSNQAIDEIDSSAGKFKSQSSFERSLSHNDSTSFLDESKNYPNLCKMSSLPDLNFQSSFNETDGEIDDLRSVKIYDSPFSHGFFHNSLWSLFKNYVSPLHSQSYTKSEEEKHFRSSASTDEIKYDDVLDKNISLMLRVMSVDLKLKSKFSTRSKCFNNVYVSKQCIRQYFRCEETPSTFVARLSKFPSRRERVLSMVKSKKGNANDQNLQKETENSIYTLVRVIVIDSSTVACSSVYNFIMCSTMLRQRFGLMLTSFVKLEPVISKPVKLTKVCLYAIKPLKIDYSAVIAAFRASIIEAHVSEQPQLYAKGCIVQLRINDEIKCNFICDIESESSSESLFSYLSLTDSPEIEIKLQNEAPIDLKWSGKNIFDSEPEGLSIQELGGIEKYKNKMFNFLHLTLSIGSLASALNDSTVAHGSILREYGILLVTGAKGCGKTSLVRAVLKELFRSDCNVYSEIMECKQMQGRRLDVLKSGIENMFAEAVEHQPSVIFFDDIEFILAAPTNEQRLRGEEISLRRYTEMFAEIMNRSIPPNTRVAVIATSISKDCIDQRLVSRKGYYLFRESIEIAPLDKEARMEILDMSILNNPRIDVESWNLINFDYLSRKTEGFVANDLCVILNRAVHAASITSNSADKVILTDFNFEKAFQDFQPSLSSNLETSTAGDKYLAQVGGLSKVKTILVKTLLWPSKYPKIFDSFPLRLRSGMLLYGPPGTGKTLIAGAVANECQMRFKSVKGPELLSKYIGASEQAIRDLFQSAEAAKPCLLFFDEFDAIAPRRGHDSTGVTDRVVNQFLTQMDGVENLDGVYILAATSRPDLIDPALLRPGRIDKFLFCPLPNQDERLEILQVLSTGLLLDDEVNLNFIADATKFFSGADLQSLLGTATIISIHEQIAHARVAKDEYKSSSNEILFIENVFIGEKSLDSEEKKSLTNDVNLLLEKYSLSHNEVVEDVPSESRKPMIKQAHLLESLKKTKPSITKAELQQYEYIYENFMKKRCDDPSRVHKEKRATLA